MDEPYEVALSFAGEQRTYVAEVAGALRSRGVRVFYDESHQADLWGKNLVEYLSQIYLNATYTVMFVSQAYIEKEWTRLERRSALERAITKQVDSVLPARFDDVDVPGLPATLGHIDCRRTEPTQLVSLLLRKLGRDKDAGVGSHGTTRPGALDTLEEVAGDRESLVRIACAEHLTVGWLDEILHAPLDHLLPVLRDLAQSAENEWQYKLAGLVAARLGAPAFTLALDIAGDDDTHWGPRTVALSWLRHASGAERDRLSAAVHAIGSKSDIDALRLQVIGYGYLGAREALASLANRADVMSSSYASEKLGSYFAQAYLDAYAYHRDEALGGGELENFSRHVKSAQKRSRYDLSFFDYHPRVAALRPGLALSLLDVAAELGDVGLLDAVCSRLSQAPNPHLAGRLAGLLEERGHASALALAFIGTEQAAGLLADAASEGDPAAQAGALLTAGVRNDHSAVAHLIESLEHTEALFAAYGAWSLAYLARDGSEPAVSALRAAVETSPHGLVRATAVAGLAGTGVATVSDLRHQFDLSEGFVEQVMVGLAGAWLGDPDVVAAGLLSGVRNAAAFSWLEEPFHRLALDALSSRSEGPFDLLQVLAQEPLIT
jgi:hypothetical protein